MFHTTANLKVYVATQPCDMRKSFDGLHTLVQSSLQSNAQSGALFVFFNKKATLMKTLYWDGTGLWVLAKRLEKGTFSLPRSAKSKGQKISITPRSLSTLSAGNRT
jgi:transposase